MKENTSDSSPLVSADEIGKLVGVTGRTVLNWADGGIVPTAVRVGRVVRFDVAAVFAALNKETARNLKTPEPPPSQP